MSEAVTRVRCEVRIHGRLRWISHLEFLRAFTRALRRADIPVAYSQGYNPHARLSFATARSVGMASDAEYVDVFLGQECTGSAVKNQLNRVFPAGIAVSDCRRVSVDGPALAARINASRYHVTVEGVARHCLCGAVDAVLDAPRLHVTRHRNNKPDRSLDIRPGIFSAAVIRGESEQLAVLVDLALGGEHGVRVEEFLGILRSHLPETEAANGVFLPRRIALYHRGDDRDVSPWCI